MSNLINDGPNDQGSQSQGPGGSTSVAPAAASASQLVDTAKHDLDTIGTEVKEQVGNLQEEVKAQIDEVAVKAKSLAADQKDLLATQVTGITAAIDKVATELEGTDATGAGYVRAIASSASKFSSTLANNDVDALLGKAQDFGRQQPAAFAGFAALLGFAASRFVMASAKRVPASTSSPMSPSSSNATLGNSPMGGGNGRI